MTFSGALTLTDLNDFLTPSQACIKPVEQVTRPDLVKEEGSASTQIHIDSAGSYYEVSGSHVQSSGNVARKLETAQISLNDCLACSGCITSAESVLITLQSHEEVLNVLSNNPPSSSAEHRMPVLSIAPQSLASLAASLSSSSSTPVPTLRQILRRVQAFCRQELGFARVYDTTFARHISLLEHTQEFQERRRTERDTLKVARLPMLASACPGWVCYAEKTHSEMLPFISRSKSPQQVMGTLVKNWLSHKWGKAPNQIYHVTVMPCYDKKLEASRQDFFNDIYATRDVDCVLTTGELELMMHERGWDLSTPALHEEFNSDHPMLEVNELPELLSHLGSSSGSYLHTLLAEYLTGETELTTAIVRSSDYEEFIVTNRSTGNVVFKGAKCYGFRNLQNVVRKVGREAGVQVGKGAAGRLALVRAKRDATGRRVKGGETEKEKIYDYVEVMACPGGCVNGGGQVKPSSRTDNKQAEAALGYTSPQPESEPQQGARWSSKDWIKKVEDAYWHDLPTPPPSPTLGLAPADERHRLLMKADELAGRILMDLCKPMNGFTKAWGDVMDVEAEGIRRALFRTEYRAVETEVASLQVKW